MNCGCEGNYHQTPTYDWYNTDNYPCNPCTDKKLCKKVVNAQCVVYYGNPLAYLQINQDTPVETILSVIDNELSAFNQTLTTLKNNIQTALNNINDRINAIAGQNDAPYQI